MKFHTKVLSMVALAFVVFATNAFASGFSIFEQSAKASGQAGAYVAMADDSAANWYNPAALMWLEESELQVGGNIITIGGATELDALDPSFGIFSRTTFEPESNIGTPIHLYYSHRPSGNIAWGIGVTTPFGLVTEWTDRPITFSAQKSELTTFVINPNVAFRMTERLSLAVGVDYIFADIGDFSREVPIDLDANPLNGFEVIGFSNLTGDGDDWGWNVALHYKGDGNAFGLTYRAALEPTIEGDIEYRNFGPLSPFFPSSPGSADLNLPEQAAIGYAWGTDRRWAFEVDVAWAGWSSFDVLEVDIQNETTFSRDFQLLEDWDDTFSYRFGVVFNQADGRAWRAGIVFDESPVPAETLRPSIPDADRTGISLGYSYEGSHWNVDAYYMALFFDDISAVGNEDGVIEGEYSSFANLAGITLSRRF